MEARIRGEKKGWSEEMAEITVQTLASGSSGNVTLVRSQDTTLLVDVGLPSMKRIKEALSAVGVSVDEIDFVVVSHAHSDHVGYSGLRLCVQHELPVITGPKTRDSILAIYERHRDPDELEGQVEVILPERSYLLGSLVLTPFLLPHDVETYGFRIETMPGKTGASDANQGATRNNGRAASIAIATDLGHVPDCVLDHFEGVDAALIEANYEEFLLDRSNRSVQNKTRIASQYGHLSNGQTASFLARLAVSRSSIPRVVMLAHLSEDHNSPEIALDRVGSVLLEEGCMPDFLYVAPRHGPSEAVLVGGRKGEGTR